MCGRYVLAMRLTQVRQHLEAQNMAVYDAPDDEGEGAPRQSYNFAPGYYGMVYRADTPDWGAGPARERRGVHGQDRSEETDDQEDASAAAADREGQGEDEGDHEAAAEAAPAQGPQDDIKYRLQSMKWGLIPFWTKRNPDYASMMRTINCRDDSLSTPGGMWATMKARKRCIVIAEGFYEWLRVGPKERVPHYIKRKDGQLLLLAGLWDCVQYEESDEKLYTYTIITTDSNPQLKFLHDRMPVILEPASDKLYAWLSPARYEWTKELQQILRPWDGELEVYPVSKEVGKVGNNSPNFIIPVNSKENKSNIANFFANAAAKSGKKTGTATSSQEEEEKKGETKSMKRKASSPPPPAESPSPKKPSVAPSLSPMKSKAGPSPTKGKLSATSNGTKSPSKQKKDGSQKITKFFVKNPS